jgi:3-hydroxybutyryl-CoA dehydratase
MNNFTIGQTAELRRVITANEVRQFAEISGDTNPIHIDRAFLKSSKYQNLVVHGLLVGGMFSSIFGTELPGHGCVYRSQTFSFKQPIYVDQEIIARVEIVDVKPLANLLVFDTRAIVRGSVAIVGKATIVLP